MARLAHRLLLQAAALAAALVIGALASPQGADAATLYITEYANGITPVSSFQPQVVPTPAVATQTVALSGSSAQSAAFNTATHVVSLICDEGCSVSFGTSPTATTSTTLLQQGVTYTVGVVPGQIVAAIANAAGNSSATVIPSGTQAVSIASGQVASGAYASGSIASGAIVDGADVAEGTTTDAAATQGSTGSVSAKLRTVTSQLNTLNTQSWTDPCASPGIAKSSVPINITSGTTTSLVAVSGSTTVYVCGFTLTISEVVTTANTLQFEYGTGASCTSPTALTGLFGAGGITAGAPITVSAQADRTVFKSAASNGVCALTAIGGSGSFQGVLTYVQQ